MVEAVVVVPALAILLVGTSFARDKYLARQHALVIARRCAWEHSMAGCGAKKLPAECEMKENQSDEAQAESKGIIDRTRSEVAQARSKVGGKDFDVFRDVPLIGDAFAAVIGKTTGATASVDVRVPWNKGDHVSASGKFALACNEQPRDVGDAIHSVFCKSLGSWACAP